MKTNYNIFHIICFYTFAFCYNTLQIYIYIYIFAIFCYIFVISSSSMKRIPNTEHRKKNSSLGYN